MKVKVNDMLRTANKFQLFQSVKGRMAKNALASSQKFTEPSNSSVSRYKIRQNSIDEEVFGCFEGYNQIISDINKSKRLLMNRRQRDKPCVSMLKKDSSVLKDELNKHHRNYQVGRYMFY